MTKRLLIVAAAAAATLVPATSASASPIIDCSATFLIGPIRCEASQQEDQFRDDNPAVDAILQQYVDPLF